MSETPIAAGKSSFQSIDSEKLFAELKLKEGITFLDIACGRGEYSIVASKHIGDRGIIHAVDRWEEGIGQLKKKLIQMKIRNIRPDVTDVSRHIAIEKESVDVCLMAMVLHDLFRDGTGEGTLREVQRVVKPMGVLALVEFKKVVQGFPRSPKVSDALLKVGYIQYENRQWGAARKTLGGLVNRYPNSTASQLAKKRLDKMASEGH